MLDLLNLQKVFTLTTCTFLVVNLIRAYLEKMLNLEAFSLVDILFEKHLMSLMSQLVIELVGGAVDEPGQTLKSVLRLNDDHLEVCQQ
jgi:hypothetical protein